MNPELAKQLRDSGQISEATYQAAIAGTASVAPPPVSIPTAPAPPPLDGGSSQEPLMSVPNAAPAPAAPIYGTGPVQGPPIPNKIPTAHVQNLKDVPTSVNDLPDAKATPPAPAMPTGPAPAPQKSAAGMQRDLLQKNLGRTKGYAGLQADISKDLLDAHTQGAEEERSAIETTLSDADESRKRETDVRNRAYEKVQATFDGIRQQLDDVKGTKIDPDRKWKNLSSEARVGQNTLFFLGGLAGGLGDGRFAGKNPALENWNKAIDRDIAAQIYNLENKKDAIKDETNLAVQDYANSKDWAGAEAVLRLEGFTMLKHRQEAIAAKIKIPEMKAKYEQGLIGLEQQIDQAADAVTNHDINVQATREKQAAAEAAARRAEYQRQLKRVETLAEAFAKGTEKDAPMTEEASLARARKIVFGKAAASEDDGDTQPTARPDKTGAAAKEKDVGERTVVVDGKEQVALNKTAAEKWNEYNHGRSVVRMALTELKEARKNGDVGRYNSAKNTLKDEYPKLLGYTRAPTEGQLNETMGEDVIPDYNHWYDPTTVAAGLAVPVVGGAIVKGVKEGRAQEKITLLEKTLETSDKAMRENTFGVDRGVSTKANDGKGTSTVDTSKIPGFKGAK